MKKTVLTVLCVMILAVPALAFENVTPTEAYYMAATEPDTYILDVRTNAEWTWVGHPGENRLGDGADLNGKVVNIAYMIEYKGDFIINPSFLVDVQNTFPDPGAVTLISMCRSGGRSVAAANVLEAAGYVSVANMITGFEGGRDASGYRTVSGWKVDGLPYTYSGDGYHDYHPGHHGNGNGYGFHK